MMVERQVPERPTGDLQPIVLQIELQPIDRDTFPVSVVQVLPVGDVHLTDARSDFKVSELSVLSLLHYFSTSQTDLAFDYDHGMYFGDNMLAAGWGEKMWAVVPGEWHGRMAQFVEGMGDRVDLLASDDPDIQGVFVFTRWTAEAAEKIQNREYRYVSPVVFFNYAYEAEYLWNAALTNNPAITGMDALAASRLPSVRPGIKNDGGESTSEPKGEDMSMERVAAVLNIDVDSTAEDFDADAFLATVDEKVGALHEAASQSEALAAENEQVKAERDEATEALKAAQEKVDAFEATAAEDEAAREGGLIDGAIADGRLAESQRKWATENFAAFETLLPTLEKASAGPPQGERHNVKETEDDLTDNGEEALVRKIREHAKENDLTFTAAFIALGKNAK